MVLSWLWKKKGKGKRHKSTTSIGTLSHGSNDNTTGQDDITLLHEQHKRFVDSFFSSIHSHNLDEFKRMAVSGARVNVAKAEADMTFNEYVAELGNVWASFPDFEMTLLELPKSESHQQVTIHVRVSGTHTGKPYGFGPFPEIEAKGTECQNDPESITFALNEDGVMTAMRVTMAGNLGGPPGFYTQIGGLVF